MTNRHLNLQHFHLNSSPLFYQVTSEQRIRGHMTVRYLSTCSTLTTITLTSGQNIRGDMTGRYLTMQHLHSNSNSLYFFFIGSHVVITDTSFFCCHSCFQFLYQTSFYFTLPYFPECPMSKLRRQCHLIRTDFPEFSSITNNLFSEKPII